MLSNPEVTPGAGPSVSASSVSGSSVSGQAAPVLAIFCLSEGSLATARRMQAALPGAVVYGLRSRVPAADVLYDQFGATVRDAFSRGIPLACLCAAGIVIRALAPLLQDKRQEPPVLAVAEDGSAVVPLLGGLSGVNALARRLAAGLETVAAITTSGEIRFGFSLETPPEGYSFGNPDDSKTVMANLLAGAPLVVDGEAADGAPWVEGFRRQWEEAGRQEGEVSLPGQPQHLTLTCRQARATAGQLLVHPRSLVLVAGAGATPLADRVDRLLAGEGYTPASLAFLLALPSLDPLEAVAEARRLGCPLRFSGEGCIPGKPGEADVAGPIQGETGPGETDSLADLAVVALQAVPAPRQPVSCGDGLALAEAVSPAAVCPAGHRRGRLTVVGLGPGCGDLMAPAVKEALHNATDVIGYIPYVEMARPWLGPQAVVHPSDNRVELDRACHAFDLAAAGGSVVVVSSGDPGIFAMASAVLEAFEQEARPAWQSVELEILPGISAAQAAAAKAGAPLGHDLCLISLSDNLKPWPVITRRLELVAEADLAMAFYNPVSRSRPWQLGEAIAILRRYRHGDTPVVLGRDVGRPAERMRVVSLGELEPEMVDMRTVVIVGSSHTRVIARPGDQPPLVYTPRWYRPEGAGSA